MNSNEEASPTTAGAKTTNGSSPLASCEVPLMGLVVKPMSQMTDEELREKVIRIQQLRTSPQTMQAAIRDDGLEPGEKPNEKTGLQKLKETFDEYL
jgi:hypothetical protein